MKKPPKLGLIPEHPATREAREARQTAEAKAMVAQNDEADLVEILRQMIRESGVEAVRRHLDGFKD